MLPGMLYFVSIRMVPLVPRGPVGKVYRDVPDAHQILLRCAQISGGYVGVKSYTILIE